jgi:hypothetical protein
MTVDSDPRAHSSRDRPSVAAGVISESRRATLDYVRFARVVREADGFVSTDGCARCRPKALPVNSYPRPHAYYLDIFTVRTWDEFLASDRTVSGFRQGSRGLAGKLEVDDLLLCYVIGHSRFVGALRVASVRYEDYAPIWTAEAFPVRVRVSAVHVLAPEEGVAIRSLITRFSWYYPDASPTAWQGHVQNTLRKWSASDGDLVMRGLEVATARSPRV